MSGRGKSVALGMALAGLMCLSGCSTVSISTRAQFRPVMDLKESQESFTKLAVLPFDGKGGEQVSALVQSALAEWGYYSLVERKALEKVVNELALQRQALFTTESAAKIGELVGASHVLIGDVTAYAAREGTETQYRTITVQEGVRTEPRQNPDGSVYYVQVPNWVQRREPYAVYTMAGDVAVSFRIVGVETGGIVYSKSISRTASGGSETRAGLPTPEGMLSEMSKSICEEFRTQICPYSMMIEKDFLKPDSEVDASVQEVDRALTLINAGDMQGAEEALKKAIELDASHAAAHFNLAMVLALQARVEEADAEILQAVRLDPGNDTIIEGRQWIQTLPR